MSVRWRADGTLVCAAKTRKRRGDTLIDDRLHYELSVNQRVLLPDVNHETNDLWHWLHSKSGPFLRVQPEEL